MFVGSCNHINYGKERREAGAGEYNKGSRNAFRTGKLRNCLVSEYARYHIRFNTEILAFVSRFYAVPIVEYCLHYYLTFHIKLLQSVRVM